MRREWSQWIRNRDWREFERLAKTDPDQVLADTVGELERGFEDKSDRKALRKVLFLLKQRGFEPAQIESQPTERPEPSPFTFAFMVSAEGQGDTVITYARQEKNQVRWLIAYTNSTVGIRDAFEEKTSVEDAPAKAKNLLTRQDYPFVGCEIPVDFALSRLRTAREATKGAMPPIIPLWRVQFDSAPFMEHPAERLPRKEADERVRENLIYKVGPMRPWRLELGVATSFLFSVYELRQQEKENPGTGSPIDTWELQRQARSKAFVGAVQKDHETRLLDLAYILHAKGDPESGTVLSVLDDVRARGSDSDYATALFQKTMCLATSALKKSPEESDPEDLEAADDLEGAEELEGAE